MKKYSFEISDNGDQQKEGQDGPRTKPKTFEELKKVLSGTALEFDVQTANGMAVVRIMHHAGTGQYFATGAIDASDLKNWSFKTEVKGAFSLYYIKFE